MSDSEANLAEEFEMYGFSEIKFTDLEEIRVNEECDPRLFRPRPAVRSMIPDKKNQTDRIVDNCEVYFQYRNNIWSYDIMVSLSNTTGPVTTHYYGKFGAEMTAGSVPSRWTLFPYQQGSELNVVQVFALLGIKEDQIEIESEIEEFSYDKDTHISTAKIAEDTILTFGVEAGEGYNMRYTLSKNGKHVTGFLEDGCWLQEGDRGTIVYLLTNGNILIDNCGDVSSTVYLEFL